jgi:hypothetical protein
MRNTKGSVGERTLRSAIGTMNRSQRHVSYFYEPDEDTPAVGVTFSPSRQNTSISSVLTIPCNSSDYSSTLSLNYLYDLQKEDPNKVPQYGSTTAEVIESVSELEIFDEAIHDHMKKNKELLKQFACPKMESIKKKMKMSQKK